MNNAPMSIAGIDVVVVAGLSRCCAVVVTIERRRILSARWRRESSRQRWGSALSHPSHSSSSVTSAATGAAADALP